MIVKGIWEFTHHPLRGKVPMSCDSSFKWVDEFADECMDCGDYCPYCDQSMGDLKDCAYWEHLMNGCGEYGRLSEESIDDYINEVLEE
jgi:hypothetical protein